MNAWKDSSSVIQGLAVYDDRDGVQSRINVGSYGPRVTKAIDGRLWFATYGGAGVVNPRRVPFHALPPRVHIEQITVDGQSQDPTPDLQLPPLVRNLRIDYTALSFAVPERVRFRHKLEGHDPDWIDAGGRRQAFYTDLPHGRFRFRVAASNSDGVWNNEGAALSFSVAPAIYQTRVFLIACAALALGSLWALYRIHLRRIATRLNERFDASTSLTMTREPGTRKVVKAVETRGAGNWHGPCGTLWH